MSKPLRQFCEDLKNESGRSDGKSTLLTHGMVGRRLTI